MLQGFAIAAATLAAACVTLQCWGGDVVLMHRSRSAIGLTEIELFRGNLSIGWRPRVAYRPQWAGQVNRYGFRYNLYSDGSGYAWTPLWVPGALLASAALVSGYRAGFRRRTAGHCPHCGYDLRATPERCPECGTLPDAAAPSFGGSPR
jgi:hypothetical protein